MHADSSILVELLDRQFEFLFSIQNENKFVRIRRLLGFLEGEPRLAEILREVQSEERARIQGEYTDSCNAIRDALLSGWRVNAMSIRAELSEVVDNALFHYGSFEVFESRLEKVAPSFEDLDEESASECVAAFTNSLGALAHWTKWIADLKRDDEGAPEAIDDLAGVVVDLKRRYEHALQHFREEVKTSATGALAALEALSTTTNPRPPAKDDAAAIANFERASKRARSLGGRLVAGDLTAAGLLLAVDQSARVLHDELRFRIGIGRSREALLRRYVTRCEMFDKSRLRELGALDSRKAERQLTDDFARYLFDQGLLPLTEASLSGLRPDVIDFSSSTVLYVEAKQYADGNPRSQVLKAFAQLWDTLGKLQSAFTIDEVFLLVFRRGGRGARFPNVLVHNGTRVFPLVVDISMAADGGSRAEMLPIEFTERDLLPQFDATS